eukprot:TRINITY_DN65590_c0_g1_i1.p1 TRINITY_DN65590_c0_g1~~TRINITY_DN65590_c0_g1_i1.p1  ORF type:complete len:1016 (-),score=200.81 TRINITY_DN65590_c0_g1_i1:136-3183(-)
MFGIMLFDTVFAMLAPLWVEVCGLLFFALGFAFLRGDGMRTKPPGKIVESSPPKQIALDAQTVKNIEAEASANNSKGILSAWRQGKDSGPCPLDTLKRVIQAFLEVEPESLHAEVQTHLKSFAATFANTKTAVAVLDTVARPGKVKEMMELHNFFRTQLQVSSNVPVYEVLLGGFASVGDEVQVKSLVKQLRASRLKLSARAYSLMIKGFLKNSLVDATVDQLLDMQTSGLTVPSFAVAQFFRICCEARRAEDMLKKVIDGGLPLRGDCFNVLLEDCARRNDIATAQKVEQLARDAQEKLSLNAYDSLLKMYTMAADPHALDLFKEMQESEQRVSEGLCVGLLARCADVKFLRFAEEISKFSRERKSMTISIYSALMKVYAFCGLYEKACDLYDQILEDGLQPDAMMYGCLMKFAVECGRTSLSMELSKKVPSLDIQNYMSLIRAAGRDRDVNRAFQVIAQLKETGQSVDSAAWNCVLDVCVLNKDMKRARELFDDLKGQNILDVISYNTLLKGYCSVGDLKAAKELLSEMESGEITPNDASYNCLINTAASSGDFDQAWEIVERMQKNNITADHYTISILSKILKKAKNQKNTRKVLHLLDSSGIDLCSDEIMFNAVLETCIRQKEISRIQSMLASYSKSKLHPSIHTYGSLIKACNVIKRVDLCWEHWRAMEEKQGAEPNDIVLGCMLDALVCNNMVEEAVTLFNEWKNRVAKNIVLYSTIVKGFAMTAQADRAMQLWREMQAEGLKLNTVMYNSVIDAQARKGLMEEVGVVVQAMAEDGCRPDAITHSTIVKGYCVKGDLDTAYKVLQDMQSRNMASDPIVYNTMLDGCTRHSRPDMAEKLLEDMERCGVVPSNFTLGILVKMYGRRKKLDQAFKLIEELPRKYHFNVNPQVYTCLLCACLNNNNVEKAVEVFEELKAGAGADAKTYSSMVAGLVRRHQYRKAISLVDEFYGLPDEENQRRRPHPESSITEPAEKLLRALKAVGQIELGEALLDKLRAAKVPLSRKLATALV